MLQVLGLLAILLLFFISLELMGGSFKLMGKGVARTLLQTTANPFVGLFIGILATSLVQSSSTVTSMTVSIVAGGGFGPFAEAIPHAIPIVMGANIGTSVTNTIVSLGSVTRRDEFRRAMAGATVHDFFNLLAVAVLFPLELLFRLVSTVAALLTDLLAGIGGTQLLSPLDMLIDPIGAFLIELSGENGVIVLILGLGMLFFSLRHLVSLLKALVLGRSEKLMHKYIFGPAPVALLFGVIITFLVQSSSITTSLTIPLVGAGIVTVSQIYPFVLGANIGTTLTALVAALALASDGGAAGLAALTVAFGHLVFNVFGILIFLPIKQMRQIPIWLSKKLGDLAVVNRFYALGYIVVVFFVIPLLTIFLMGRVDIDYSSPIPDAVKEEPVPTDTSSSSPSSSVPHGEAFGKVAEGSLSIEFSPKED